MLASVSWAQAPVRERMSFNQDWRFAQGDPNGAAGRLSYKAIRDWVLPTGVTFTKNPNFADKKRPAGNPGLDVAYTQPGFEDKGWRSVTLPHDWGIEGPFDPKAPGGTGKLPFAGIGWYRKHFTVPAGDQGRQLYLDVDGAMSYANVWLNGQYVGGWPYGYASWQIDLTPYVRLGGENVIAIRLENPPNSSRSSYSGIIDLAGFKKDRFYLYQAHWRPDFPMAHILPHWTWPERIGQVTPVHVFTSGDEAELFLNGKSLGRKTKGRYEYRLRWDDVTYEPGELKVVACKKGKEWATDVMRTAGSAAKLLAQADRSAIADDGLDLSFVTVTVADQNDILVPRSRNRIRFSLDGPGEIVATDNGDPTSFESFQSKERNAFHGLCLAIVRAQPGQTGTVTLKAQSEGLQEATVTLHSEAAR